MPASRLAQPAPLRALLARGAGSAMVSGFLLVALLTMVGKIVAFAKDAVVASKLGTADDLDAYMLVFGFFTFAGSVLGGGIPESFVPAYAELRERRGLRRAYRLGIQCAASHFAALLICGLLLALAAPWVVGWATKGFDPAKQALAVSLLRGLLPFLLCFGLAQHLSTWLRAGKTFLLAAASPMLVPLGIVASLLLAGDQISAWTLVHGTVWGAVAHLSVLLVAILRRLPRKVSWWRCSLRHWEPGLRAVLRNAVPFLIGGVAFGSAVVVDQTMAAWLAAGSVAVLGYSEKVCAIVLAVTAGPASDVLFPHFAELVAKRDWNGLRRRLFTSAGIIVSAALPMTLALCLLAPWIVRTLFERGAFGPQDTQRVAEVLRYAAFQIPFYILGTVAARIVISLQASRYMLTIAFSALFLNASLNWLLMRPLGAAGIALSTTIVHCISAFATCATCLIVIRRKEAA
ncbi:lipid II flippase MurJ [Prosthecobacter sp.]|uniref:murein biosynthesis integral membrane protein MurJ n=1 Tax=Prosthecobacter sp. TaxID=1965333 RepID=UPI002488EA5E|nr:lipid II flippase MurJ [Prosthecobacter sp.]MDI1314193.1 lipid II flippase MurJ [Prosthecobacter sp.]